MATETRSGASGLTRWLDDALMTASPETLEELEEIVTDVGKAPWLWGHAVTFDPKRRSHRVLYQTPLLKIALFGWAAGQDTVFHDHGGASGAAFICSGMLVEDTIEAVDGQVVAQYTHTRRAETAFSFGADYIHRVRHDPGYGVALSIHVYTPAVSDSVDYEVIPDGTLRARRGSRAPAGLRTANAVAPADLRQRAGEPAPALAGGRRRPRNPHRPDLALRALRLADSGHRTMARSSEVPSRFQAVQTIAGGVPGDGPD
jgi:predicted metal-dependent enzyme (double-stranded beta helix superfamily)